MVSYSLAVDLGGTRIRTAVSDASLNLSGKQDERTSFEDGAEGGIHQIARMATASMQEAGIDRSEIVCLAVGSPGPLDANSGVVLSPPNMPGWQNVPLKARLEAATGINTKVMNDANAAALGEFNFGAGREVQNMVYITISTGIGAGVVMNGRLLEGASGTAGEIGHMTIDRRGPACKCGNIGCLEMIASGTSIARRASERLAKGEQSVLSERKGDGLVTGVDVTRAARLGDALALAVFTDAAEAIGHGVVNCLHVFNPEVVVIGGGVTGAGRLLFDTVERIVDQYALDVPKRAARIVPAQLGDDVGLYGAAAVALAQAGELPA